MITEADVQLAMQTAMQTISLFASADVVINDWDVLNQAGAKAPYVVIENSETLDSRQDVADAEHEMEHPYRIARICRGAQIQGSYG